MGQRAQAAACRQRDAGGQDITLFLSVFRAGTRHASRALHSPGPTSPQRHAGFSCPLPSLRASSLRR